MIRRTVLDDLPDGADEAAFLEWPKDPRSTIAEALLSSADEPG